MADPTLPAPLARLAADYWDTVLELDPMLATAVGDRRFDALLPDPTPEGRGAGRERLTSLEARLADLPLDAAWDAEARITCATLAESLHADIATIDSGLAAWNVDPVDGLPTSLLNLPDYQLVETPADGTAMVVRWRAIAEYLDRSTGTLRRGLAGGLVASAPTVERTIDMVATLLAEPDEDWPLLAPIAAVTASAAADAVAGGKPRTAAWTTADHERFAAGLRDAVANDIRPAFARLHAALTDEILPAARSADRPGMGHVPGGLDGYRELIRVHTSLDLTPDELHQTGLAEIDRIDAELRDLTARTIGARSLPEALVALRADPALHFSSREEVRAKAASSLTRAAEAIPAWFGRLPQAPCEVVVIGPHEEEHTTIAYYRNPAPDGSRPGQYYINTSHPETRPRYEAEALAYHESIPGHHLQIAIAQELPMTAEFRRHLGPTAFFEGWGLYTERLSDEMGLYSGDLDRIGVLSFDAWRASRLVVDTGMHALGWTRRQAIDFMLEHSVLALNNIVNEVDRYLAMPGQALAYKAGQLEILRLRRAARERLGPAFDIRGFHDAVLGSGAIPLAVLGEVVAAWAEEVAAAR